MRRSASNRSRELRSVLDPTSPSARRDGAGPHLSRPANDQNSVGDRLRQSEPEPRLCQGQGRFLREQRIWAWGSAPPVNRVVGSEVDDEPPAVQDFERIESPGADAIRDPEAACQGIVDKPRQSPLRLVEDVEPAILADAEVGDPFDFSRPRTRLGKLMSSSATIESPNPTGVGNYEIPRARHSQERSDSEQRLPGGGTDAPKVSHSDELRGIGPDRSRGVNRDRIQQSRPPWDFLTAQGALKGDQGQGYGASAPHCSTSTSRA